MTLSDITKRTLRRLGEDPDLPAAYTPDKVIDAINRAQRLYAFATLCLESTQDLPLSPGTAFYHLLNFFPSFLVALRVRRSVQENTGTDGTFDVPMFGSALFDDRAATVTAALDPKLYPISLSQLQALDAAWMTRTGAPTRYGVLGQDLFYCWKNPDVLGYQLAVTFARLPAPMIDALDVPEIPEADHQALVHGAVAFCRLKEGGAELSKAMQDDAGLFADAIKSRARATRARSQAQRYDTLPSEIDRLDLSSKADLRGDLPPKAKRPPWPIA